MFAGWRWHTHLCPRAVDAVIAAGDGRAALPALISAFGDRAGRARRAEAALLLAIADGCDVLLAWFGCITICHLVAEDPAAARPIAAAIDAAVARGRCPAPTM